MAEVEANSEQGEIAAPRAKWGVALDAGFQIIPDVLFRHQRQLGLSSLDVVIILNVALHWWDVGSKPYPRTAAIAARMGVSSRTIERRFVALEAAGLIRRLASEKLSNGPVIRRIDLSGLSTRLQNLARQEPGYDLRRKAA